VTLIPEGSSMRRALR